MRKNLQPHKLRQNTARKTAARKATGVNLQKCSEKMPDDDGRQAVVRNAG